jgi:hypothetical protein
MERKTNAYIILIGNPQGKIPPGRAWMRDNVGMDVRGENVRE